MLTTGSPLRALILLLAACAVPWGEPTREGLDLEGQYYRDRNGVWVHTGLLAFRKALARKLGLEWTQTYDIMSGASRSLGRSRTGRVDSAHAVDGVTRASARESRHAARASLVLGDDRARLTGNLYGSREEDYVSVAPGLGLFRSFHRGNTSLAMDLSGHFDRSHPAPPFRDLGGSKHLGNMDISVTRVLTPRLVAAAGGSLTFSRGRLGHPYTPTITASGEVLDESLPARRLGSSLFLQALQGFVVGGRLGAVDLRASRYQDDWGLVSHSADLKVSRNLPGDFTVRLRLRGYGQQGAAFTRRPYQGDERFHSADVRLHTFQSLLAGLKLSGGLPEAWGEPWYLPRRWDLAYERTFRDTPGDRPGANRTYQLYAPDARYTQDVARLGLHFGF